MQKDNMQQISAAKRSMIKKYGLDGNADVRIVEAESLFGDRRWEECNSVTSRYAKRH